MSGLLLLLQMNSLNQVKSDMIRMWGNKQIGFCDVIKVHILFEKDIYANQE